MNGPLDEKGVRGDPDRLLSLLPAHVRARDEQSGGALRALLSAVAGELEVLEQELSDLYDGWFVETCGRELLPYLGELIGLNEALPDLGEEHDWRTVVAHTVSYRRRKGTLAVLEQVAGEVTGWQAHAVEYFKLLATTAHVNHVRLDRAAVASIRGARRLDHTGGPHPCADPATRPQDFERGALDPLLRTAEVRGAGSGGGRYGISRLGVFLFPLTGHAAGDADAPGRWPQARPEDPRHDRGRWTFDALGRPTPLFAAAPSADAAHERASWEGNLPVPLQARRLHALLEAARRGELDAEQLPLGVRIGRDRQPLPPERLRVCGLEPLADGDGDQACVDPLTGRLTVFRDRRPLTTQEVFVRYHYGTLAELGAGTHDRSEGFQRALAADGYDGEGIARRIDVGPGESIAGALRMLPATRVHPGSTVIVAIGDSDSRAEDVVLTVPDGVRLVLVAAAPPHREPATDPRVRTAGAVCVPQGIRPHLRGSLLVDGGQGGSLVLDGLAVEGDVTVTAGSLARIVLSQCTVTGRVGRAAPTPPGSAQTRRLEVIRCVVRALDWPEGVHAISVTDSVVDAGAAGPAVTAPGARLELAASTLRGAFRARTLDAVNTVFDGPVHIDDRQEGGLRHCYAPPGSLTSRRFRCVPASRDHSMIRPVYASEEPGSPLYLALARTCPDAIREGGEGGTEMGVYHHLRRPLRRTAVRRYLAAYVPAEMESKIIGS